MNWNVNEKQFFSRLANVCINVTLFLILLSIISQMEHIPFHKESSSGDDATTFFTLAAHLNRTNIN